MSSEVARVLREAADLIEPPGRWTREENARDAAGVPCTTKSDIAACWCMDGAIRRCAPTDRLWMLARQTVAEITGGFVTMFNDSQESAEPVVAVLRAAADKAERADV